MQPSNHFAYSCQFGQPSEKINIIVFREFVFSLRVFEKVIPSRILRLILFQLIKLIINSYIQSEFNS